MKKLLIIIPVFLVLLWITIFCIDLKRVSEDKLPIITFKESISTYDDGKVYEYVSLGYVARFYDRALIKSNEVDFILTREKYKYLTIGPINEVSKIIKDKEIGKGNYLKLTALVNNPDELDILNTYTNQVVVSEDLKMEQEVVFDENVIFKCDNLKNNSNKEYKQFDEITIYGQIKNIVKKSDKYTVYLRYCITE